MPRADACSDSRGTVDGASPSGCRGRPRRVSFRPVPSAPFRVSRLLDFGTIAALVLCAACGGRSAPPPEPAPVAAQATERPLAPLATQPILVLPLQGVYPADSLGWYAQISDESAFRRRVDDEIAFALRSRGVTSPWIMPEEVARAVRRNPTLDAPDPYELAAGPLAPGVELVHGNIPAPLASQLRALIALGTARYALVPVEVRFFGKGSEGFAQMRVAFVDARASTLRGTFDVRTDSMTTFSEPAIATSLAEKFADLIAAP